MFANCIRALGVHPTMCLCRAYALGVFAPYIYIMRGAGYAPTRLEERGEEMRRNLPIILALVALALVTIFGWWYWVIALAIIVAIIGLYAKRLMSKSSTGNYDRKLLLKPFLILVTLMIVGAWFLPVGPFDNPISSRERSTDVFLSFSTQEEVTVHLPIRYDNHRNRFIIQSSTYRFSIVEGSTPLVASVSTVPTRWQSSDGRFWTLERAAPAHLP